MQKNNEVKIYVVKTSFMKAKYSINDNQNSRFVNGDNTNNDLAVSGVISFFIGTVIMVNVKFVPPLLWYHLVAAGFYIFSLIKFGKLIFNKCCKKTIDVHKSENAKNEIITNASIKNSDFKGVTTQKKTLLEIATEYSNSLHKTELVDVLVEPQCENCKNLMLVNQID